MTDREHLMSAWIALQENWWAHGVLYEKCESDPEFAWFALVELIERGPSRDVLEVTAAGPFEDPLRAHGPWLIDRVEACAITSAPLREALALNCPTHAEPRQWLVVAAKAGWSLSHWLLSTMSRRLPSWGYCAMGP